MGSGFLVGPAGGQLYTQDPFGRLMSGWNQVDLEAGAKWEQGT